MEISFSSNSTTDDHIATTFGTCHDSPAVVPCAKYCSDRFISIWMRAKWNFHHIWNVMEKMLVKWAPDTQSYIMLYDYSSFDRSYLEEWYFTHRKTIAWRYNVMFYNLSGLLFLTKKITHNYLSILELKLNYVCEWDHRPHVWVSTSNPDDAHIRQ